MKTKISASAIALLLLFSFSSYSQVINIGAAFARTDPGTALSVGALLLQPSDTFILNNTTVHDTAAPVNVSGTGSIDEVFNFSSPVSFTGTATLMYTVGGLNGNSAADLVIAYNGFSGDVYTLDCGSVADNMNQTVTSSPLSGATFYNLTAVQSTFTVAAITGTFSLCAGSNGTVSDATPGGTWSSSAPGIAAVGATGDLTGVAAGTAVISYSVSNSCHTVVVTATVTVNANPGVTATATSVSCHGDADGTITTTVSGGTSPYTYSWSGGASGPNPTALAPGTYSVTVTDNNGCIGYASATVTEPATLTATATATPVACGGGSTGSVTVTASGGTAPYTGTGTYTSLSAGTYSYTVTDAHGCTTSVTATVTAAPAFTVTANITPVYTVAGQAAYTIFLGYGPNTVTVSATPSGGSPGYTYSWAPSSSIASPTAATTAISPTVTTTYTVTVTDAHGCTATATATEHVIDVSCCAGHSGHCEKVSVCHNGHTLCIASSAVAAHLAHPGDYLGACTGGKPGSEDESAFSAEANEARIFPNPNDGMFNVMIPASIKEATVSVLDLTGKTVLTKLVQENDGMPIPFDIASYAPGVYFVRINSGDYAAVLKVVRQ